MKLLLDTHVFLWAFLEPERIPHDVAQELESAANDVYISPISVWECMVLGEKGQVMLYPDPEAWIRSRLRELPHREAPPTTEAAIRSRLIELPQGDPADRFLAATAVVFDLTLVTADTRLLKQAEFRTLPWT